MSLITYLTRIHFADRVLEDALPEEILRLGVRRLLVVTDGLGEGADHFDRVADALPPECDAVPLRDLRTPVTAPEVAHALDVAASTGCTAVLGLGASSALGVARRLGLGTGAAVLPVIAVPTTTATIGLGQVSGPAGRVPAGTGKSAVGGCLPVPTVILCDPTMTLATGFEVTAAAGMDALVHCIEAYLGTTWNPPADGIALEGARRAWASLGRAVADGEDIEARREMLAAALNAGLAAQKGLGAVHALAHALEAELGLADRHGWLHAALLRPVLEFNAPAVADRFITLREALRLPAEADLPGALAEFGARLSLPRRLAGFGMDGAALDRVAALAAEDPANLTNPRLATPRHYRRILEEAL